MTTGDVASFNLADLWEAVTDRVAEREAALCGSRRVTYAELEARANRLASVLAAAGIGEGDHLGVHLRNGIEYLETMLAAYKLRAVPININHRYVADELRYLYDDAELVAVVVHDDLLERVREVRDPAQLRLVLVVEGDDPGINLDATAGEQGYEAALAGGDPERVDRQRSGDDRYVIYTGGTTGLPKGVVWRHEDAFFACVGGGDPMRLQGPVESPDEVLDRIIDGAFTSLPVAPLMHAAAQWTSLSWLLAGGRVVLLPGSFDAHEVWDTIEREGVNLLIIVGDAIARPLVDAWDAGPERDLSTLLSIGSGGAPLTPTLRDRLCEIAPNAAVVDGFGSSETGAQGSQRLEPGQAATGATRFAPYGDRTAVLDEQSFEMLEAGSGRTGRVALRGRIPLGYHNDPERTTATFVHAHGERWVLTGDVATVEADGTITLFGRGSACINTGGEKVFAEEVEAVLKSNPAIYDAVVVGVPDERWGQRVVAVAAAAPAAAASTVEVLEHCRTHLAGYKLPKQLIWVSEVQRTPVGKADYRWAATVAQNAGVPDGVDDNLAGTAPHTDDAGRSDG